MANEVLFNGIDVPKAPAKGKTGKMTKGKGWKLVATKGQRRYFNGTLISTFNFGNTRIAVFTVPK